MESTEGWYIDADLAIPHLRELGWSVESIPWRRADVDWNHFEAVYICTPWDYPEDANLFLSILEQIDRSGAQLVNALETVRWNIAKTYLRDLQSGGVDIVPSFWFEDFNEQNIDELCDQLGCEQIIVKPVVSTNASNTYLLSRGTSTSVHEELREVFEDRPLIVQRYISSITSDGELSLFYIGGEYSHAIRKVPKSGDFRVQEEHGAQLSLLDPPEPFKAAARKTLNLVRPSPLYARCDFVRDVDGVIMVMELELIEPSLYLRMQPGSAARFASAFDEFVTT